VSQSKNENSLPIRLRKKIAGWLTGLAGMLLPDGEASSEPDADAAVWESTPALLQFLNLLPFAVLLRDANGRYLSVNESAANLIGVPASELIGKCPNEIETLGDGAILATVAEEDALLGENASPEEDRRSSIDGTGRERTFDHHRSPFQMNDGLQQGLLVISVDRSDEVEAEAKAEAFRIESTGRIVKMISALEETKAELRTEIGQREANESLLEASLTSSEEVNAARSNLLTSVAKAMEALADSRVEVAECCATSRSSSEESSQTSAEATRAAEALSEQAIRIAEVSSMISKIAARSRLLALNAKIEASTAGEAGRGFGVVADEVKNLANSVAEASERIEADATQMVTGSTEVIRLIRLALEQAIKVASDLDSIENAITSEAGTVDDLLEQIDSNGGVDEVEFF